MECGVCAWSVECGVWSVWSGECVCGVGSVWSVCDVECGVCAWSVECGV